MASAEAAGDALNKYLGVWFDKNGQVIRIKRLGGGLGNDFFCGVRHAVRSNE